MPSGYTHLLQEGAGFKTFAKRCLRAFGASIHMRDEPMDKDIELAKPSTYHKEAIDDAKKELEEATKLSHKAIKKLIIAQWKKDKKRAEEYLEKELKVLKNYEDALKEAKAYQPPTDEHVNYKNFMIEQIEESIKWDCGSIEQYKLDVERLQKAPDTGDVACETYRQELMYSCEEDIKYHEKEWKAELERVGDRNEWLEQALESIDKH